MIVELDKICDQRGCLVAIEGSADLPFPIKRVYYIFGVASGSERGFHAHRDLEQLMICVNGHCTVTLDTGVERKDFRLARPDRGLMIQKLTWREMRDFSDDAVVVVLASAPYEPQDYIYDYDEFIGVVKGATGRIHR